MKRTKSLIVAVTVALSVMLCAFCGCGNKIARFKEEVPKIAPVGEMIDFNGFIEKSDSAEVKVKCTFPDGSVRESSSMYFLAEETGVHKFALTFTEGGKSETLECEIEVTAVAPSVTHSSASVYCELNEELTFYDIFMDSGVRVTPAGFFDYRFNYAEYSDEKLSVEDYSCKTVREAIPEDAKSYKFTRLGSYSMGVTVYNKSGSADTVIKVSVTDPEAGKELENVKFEGVVFGEGKTVKLLQGASESYASYIGYDQKVSLEVGDYIALDVKFYGMNAPQIMMFSDALSGSVVGGTGYILSLEHEQPFDRMRIYGPSGFGGKLLVQRERSFGRATLNDKSVYLWKIIVTRNAESRHAVKSVLYEKNEGEWLVKGTFQWADFRFSVTEGYIAFLGSTNFGEVVAEYANVYACDVNGNAVGEK